MRIGLIGGTFNPIHHGHLFLAQEARYELDLEQIWFIPNRAPVHKKTDLAPATDRLAMVRAAIADRPEFDVCTLELDSGEPSYTIDTLRRLPAEHRYTFITGADALRYRWKALDEVLERLELMVAATRPGFGLDELGRHLDGLGLSRREKVRVLDMPALDISSSDIRARVAQGRPVGYLVPSAVERYIRQHHLYRKGVKAASG